MIAVDALALDDGAVLVGRAPGAADLVVICTESGTASRPSAVGRLLHRLEVGQTIERRCAYCQRVTLHAVMHREDADRPEVIVESLVSAFEHVGVIVRRYPKNWAAHDQAGVVINRYFDHGNRHEVMLFGPITSAELVPLLRQAHDSRTLPDADFWTYRDERFGGRWHPVQSEAARAKFAVHRLMASLQLQDVFGQPPEVGCRPEPPMWKFAADLMAQLAEAEREALVAALSGRPTASADQMAVLAAPFGYRDGRRTDRAEVTW